jgi:hypothetical protein
MVQHEGEHDCARKSVSFTCSRLSKVEARRRPIFLEKQVKPTTLVVV